MRHENNPNRVGPLLVGNVWRRICGNAHPVSGNGLPGLRLRQQRSWTAYGIRCVLLALSASTIFGCASLATSRGIKREAYQRGLVRTDSARADIKVLIPGFSGSSEVDLPPPPSIPRIVRLQGDTVERTVYIDRLPSQDTVRFTSDSLDLKFWQTRAGRLGFSYKVKPRVITREVKLPCETVDPPEPTLLQRIWSDAIWYLIAMLAGAGVSLYVARRLS